MISHEGSLLRHNNARTHQEAVDILRDAYSELTACRCSPLRAKHVHLTVVRCVIGDLCVEGGKTMRPSDMAGLSTYLRES